jgi:phosphohistidine swiveling domain-containing protein
MSQSAVLSCEYGIPAIVGSSTAKAVIRIGQVIEMDGTGGGVWMA